MEKNRMYTWIGKNLIMYYNKCNRHMGYIHSQLLDEKIVYSNFMLSYKYYENTWIMSFLLRAFFPWRQCGTLSKKSFKPSQEKLDYKEESCRFINKQDPSTNIL